MTSTTSRADARRSRRLLLQAGIAAFAEGGIDVQVSEITRRAGLAKGTFFRHFPTKRALLITILVESVQRLTQIAQSLVSDAGENVIARYMTAAAEDLAPVRAVIENAILRGIDDTTIVSALDELLQALDRLVDDAKARGEVREDITALDIHTVLLAATSTSAHFFFRDHPELWRRYVALALDGLQPAAARPLPLPPPTLPPSPT